MKKLTGPETVPSISVIIAAYNEESYISQAIQSVLDQTHPDFELIVVDDGSTDGTAQILAGVQDPRIRIVHQPNAGLSAARNTGLRESRAPLVAFLDADDFYLPDKLAVQSSFLDSHPEAGLVCGGTQIVDLQGHPLGQWIKAPISLELSGFLTGNPFAVTAVLVRKLWFDRVGMFDESLRACEDWDLWIRMAYAGCRFAWLEHLVVAYRYHQGQMTRESDRMRKAILTVLDKFFSQPDIPEHLRIFKNIAYGSAFVNAAAFAYHSSEFHKGQCDLAEALCQDPTLKDKQYKRLIELLVAWSHNPRSTEPDRFLQRVIANPPPSQPGLGRQLRRARADVLLGALFKSPRETWRARRWDLLSVILSKPDWLLNRGVLRMMAEAWYPF